MLSVLSYPASTIVATAAFTGLRRSELRGLQWENYREGALWVTQSVWAVRQRTQDRTEQRSSPGYQALSPNSWRRIAAGRKVRRNGITAVL
jgi:integrase